MISSLTNRKVKRIRRLQTDRRYRQREKAFVVEGTRWLLELNRSQHSPELILCTEAWRRVDEHNIILQRFSAQIQVVTDEIMAAISATQTPPGVLAVVPMQPLSLPQEPSLVLILDAVTNPGNMGTMLRSAGAAGVDVVFLASDCVDLYNPKVLRGGMGAHLRVPIHPVNWEEISSLVSGVKVWLATAEGEIEHTAVDWRQPSALIIGNEARGSGHQARKLAHGRVAIPMAAATESLNAAVAASVILFEAARQRRDLTY